MPTTLLLPHSPRVFRTSYGPGVCLSPTLRQTRQLHFVLVISIFASQRERKNKRPLYLNPESFLPPAFLSPSTQIHLRMYYCVYCKRKPALTQKTQCTGTRILLACLWFYVLLNMISFYFFRKMALCCVFGFRLLQISFTTEMEMFDYFLFARNWAGNFNLFSRNLNKIGGILKFF